jgi:hypothetical protein
MKKNIRNIIKINMEYEEDYDEFERSYVSLPKKLTIYYPFYLPSYASEINKNKLNSPPKIEKTIDLPKYSKCLTEKKNKPDSSLHFIINVPSYIAYEAAKCAITNGKTCIKIRLI